MVVFRRAVVILVTGTLSYAGATVAQTGPDSEPSGRVGRLAFLQGAVSFHDNEQTDWAPALVNTPVTSGDAIWTEPNAKSEISIAGTRVRMDGASQLEMLALDDLQTRMQLDQGRVDIKTFAYDAKQPYEIVTPRGVISLQQQGDYYVEAGTTQDPTRLGVRQGAAQMRTVNGQLLAVRAGEVGEVSGDGSVLQLHTIKTAPPPMPASWAERDRQVVYDRPPQYLSASVTGYEDLNHYGTWSNDPEYGQVWAARSVPDGWSPYSTGRWTYERTYGWTWVDEQPWGFAPYHYGRWAQRNNRWFWVPPERQQRAVYAPALVAFIGGVELGLAIGAQNRAPVGWFPLGPREAYVPSYTSNRDYYRRLNINARVQQQVMDDRWQRAQRREAIAENNQQLALMNRRFATVVSSEDFARSRPVQRSAIRVSADKIASAPVAFVAAPPSPNTSIRNDRNDGRPNDGRNDARNDGRPNDGRNDARNDGRPNDPSARGQATVPGQANVPTAPTRLGNMQAIKPEPEHEKAPGPKFVSRGSQTGAEQNKAALPQLAPRNEAVAPVKIEGDRKPADAQSGEPTQANAPKSGPTVNLPGVNPRPGEGNRAEPNRPDQRPGQPPQANAPAVAPPALPTRPGEPNRADQRPDQPGQANLPPVRDRNEQRPERSRADDDQRDNKRSEPKSTEPARPDQPPRPGEANRPEPQRQGEPRPADAQRPGQPPQPNQAVQPQRPEPPKPAENRAAPPPQQQATPSTRPVEPPKPPQAQAVPQPTRPADPPKPLQAKPEQAEPAKPQPPAQRPDRQGQVAPTPPQQAPAQARAPAPPPPQQQAAPVQQRQAPPPQQQAQQPAPPPPQVQRPAPPPQQVQAPPPPQPQRQAAPPQPPAPPPQQQAQQPQQQQQAPQQQAQQPAPQKGGGNQKDDNKK